MAKTRTKNPPQPAKPTEPPAFPAIGGVTDVEVLGHGGVKMIIGIRYLGPRAVARWAAQEKAAKFDEMRRLAALRREVSREDVPELFSQLGPEGDRIRLRAIELLGMVAGITGQLAKQLIGLGQEGAAEVETRIEQLVEEADQLLGTEPYRTAEYQAADADIGRNVLRDAVAYVRGLRFGDVRSDDQTEAEVLLDMLERSGGAQVAIQHAMAHQTPTPRQSF